MNQPAQDTALRNAAHWLIPGLFALIPLVYDADLYSFALLPKRLLLQVGVLVLAVLWARELAGRRLGWTTGVTFLPAVLLTLWTAVSTLPAAHNPFAATAFLAQQLSFFALYLLFAHVGSAALVERAAVWGSASAVLFALIGIVEFWGGDVSFIPSNGRPGSTFAYRNFAATYCAAILPITTICILRARDRAAFTVGAVAFAVSGLFLVYTRSRGAWLGAAFAGVVAVGLWAVARFEVVPRGATIRRPRAWIVPAALILVAVVAAPWSPRISTPYGRAIDENKAELLDAMSSLTSPDASRGRWHMWSATGDIIADYPLLGVGPDNWQFAYPAYDGGEMIRVGSAPERPHNDLLWIAADTGIPGALAYLWLLAAAVTVVWRLSRKGDEKALLAVCLIASVTTVAIHGQFSFPRERVEASFLFWGSLGLIEALARKRPGRQHRPLPLPTLLPGVAGLALIMTIQEIRFDGSLLRALQSFQGGDTVSLDRHTREGIDAGPFDSRIYLLRNKADQAGRNYALAIDACLDGLRYHPNSVELLGDLGMVYAMGGDLEKAESTLLRVSKLAPHHYQVFNNLGGVYQRMGRLEQAESAYLKAAGLDATYVDTRSNLGILYLQMGRHDDAVRILEEALRLSPNDPSLHHNLADALYVRAGESDRTRAARHYQVFLRTWRGAPEEAGIAKARLAEISGSP